MNLEYKESLDYLINNRDKVKGFSRDSDGLKFYSDQQIIVMTGSSTIQDLFLEEIKQLKDCGVDTKDTLDIYNTVFGG